MPNFDVRVPTHSRHSSNAMNSRDDATSGGSEDVDLALQSWRKEMGVKKSSGKSKVESTESLKLCCTLYAIAAYSPIILFANKLGISSGGPYRINLRRLLSVGDTYSLHLRN